MLNRDTLEFSAALVVGALVATAMVQSLRPDRGPTHRVKKRLGKPLGRTRSSARSMAAAAGDVAKDGKQTTRHLGELGREFVRAAADEMQTVTSSASPTRRLQSAMDRLRSLASGRR